MRWLLRHNAFNASAMDRPNVCNIQLDCRKGNTMRYLRKSKGLWLVGLFLLVSIVLQATPFGVAVERLYKSDTIYFYFSYFSPHPALTYNVFPMISALTCAASAILLCLRLFRPQEATKYGKGILILMVLSAICSGITYWIAPTGVSATITVTLSIAIVAYAVTWRVEVRKS